MTKFEIYNVEEKFRKFATNRKEPGGYLTKFWVNQPELGRSLIKLDEDTAPGWSEKVVYELATLLKLPAARYELGVYQNQSNVSLSPDFKDPKLTYINGDTLIRNDIEPYQYNVENSFQALELNQVGLPNDYQAPEGISDGADLFVGYLMLDALIANNDRHGGNWEIAINNRGIKTLAPVYDNGASFGVDFGSLVYDNRTPQEYSETIVSMFGVTTQEAFNQAAKIRPKAANVWQSQLAKIDRYKIQGLFNRVPENLITTKAKRFAFELIDRNQQQILDRDTPILPTPAQLRQQYLNYRNNINIPQTDNPGYFAQILQQEKNDIAVAKAIINEFDGENDLAIDKVRAVLSQSDRVLKLKESNNLIEINLYQQRVVAQASATINNRSRDRDLER